MTDPTTPMGKAAEPSEKTALAWRDKDGHVHVGQRTEERAAQAQRANRPDAPRTPISIFRSPPD